jgi:hypothetical protein
MDVKKVYEIAFNKEKREYRFISEGPMGAIIKVVRFDPMDDTGYYNLSFGDLCKDETIDDESVTNNKDRETVLATIKQIVHEFTNIYPENPVFFIGSTPVRTRLFRMIL